VGATKNAFEPTKKEFYLPVPSTADRYEKPQLYALVE